MTHSVLVTGASSGIGHAVAARLRDAGCEVFGAARRTDRIPAGVHPIRLDLADPNSVDAAAQSVRERATIDILINCAGYGEFGAIEDTRPEDARHELAVNLIGPTQLTRLLLPDMRRRGRGRIVNISSLAGEFSSPLGGWYHASKFALEALSDALRGEVRQFGIDVVVVQPSYVDTAWHRTATERLAQTSGDGPYRRMADSMRNHFASNGVRRQMSTVDQVAAVVVRAALAERPKTRYRVGRGATTAVALSRLLPDRAFDAMTRKQFGYTG